MQGRFAFLVLAVAVPWQAWGQGRPLEVELVGRVAPRCSVEGPSALSVGAVEEGGSRTLTFSLACNAPFSWRIRAEKGALAASGGGAEGFADRIPYRVRLELPVVDGRRTRLVAECPGSALAASVPSCGMGDSGDAIAPSVRGRLEVVWALPRQPLLAGAYWERLDLKVAVRP